MTEGQTGTSTGERTSIGRLTADPSRARCRSGGTSAKAARIAAIPEGPAPDDAAAASAETHRGGSPAGGSGGSRSASPVPAWLRGRVSRRACVEWCRAENPWMRDGAGSRRTGGRAERAPAVGAARRGCARAAAASRLPPTKLVSSSPSAAAAADAVADGRTLAASGSPPVAIESAEATGDEPWGAPRVSRTDSGRCAERVAAGPMDWAAAWCVTPQLRTAAGPAIPPNETDDASAC